MKEIFLYDDNYIFTEVQLIEPSYREVEKTWEELAQEGNTDALEDFLEEDEELDEEAIEEVTEESDAPLEDSHEDSLEEPEELPIPVEYEEYYDIPENATFIRPQDGLYKAKFNPEKEVWEESITEEEITEMGSDDPIISNLEERIEALETAFLEITEMMMGE